MPKRPSGGKRAGDKRRRERAAQKARAKSGGATSLQAQYQALGDPPTDPRELSGWYARAASKICAEAVNDFALPPEQRRRSAMQLIRWAIDTLDSAKHTEDLRELYTAVKEGRDAASLPSGDGDLSTSPSTLV